MGWWLDGWGHGLWDCVLMIGNKHCLVRRFGAAFLILEDRHVGCDKSYGSV